MQFIADFHIHSKYSYATSKFMDLQSLSTWGQLKGIKLMGTGDFTHPFWQAELEQQLEPLENGLFQLKPSVAKMIEADVYDSCKSQQNFLLTAEIATIFSRNKKTYKVHSIILAPSFQVAVKISKQLAKIGNINSDGRPILGMDVKDLLKIVLDASPDCMLIPAHIWTPHFGLLGSKSGFNSVDECFEELSSHIYALETGLSSNFLMNAKLSQLDRFSLLCNSDAHSVQKLGREANLMDCEMSYDDITMALRENDPKKLVAGIEFYSERGKYYGDGHRKCNVYVDPVVDSDNICIACRKPVTVGVARRVEELADRSTDQAKNFLRKNYQVVPLQDIISDHLGFAQTSKKVQNLYQNMLGALGNEFHILLNASIEDIQKCSNDHIAHSILKMRTGDVTVTPGYDGEYGVVQFGR